MPGRCLRFGVVTALMPLVVALFGCSSATGSPAPPSASESPAGAPADPSVDRSVLLGYSVRHRPIVAVEIGDPDSPVRVLIVGCIHGNEPAGIAIATALARRAPPAEADVWIVPDLNPDGVAAGTRANADGVDLNRNFPQAWRPLGPPGSSEYAGPRPLSEPESRLIAALVTRLRPRLTIYYHQALDTVDDSEGPVAAERRYARLAGLPLRALTDYPGSAVGWQDALLGPTAFVVELPAGALSPASVRRHAAAIGAILPRG